MQLRCSLRARPIAISFGLDRPTLRPHTLVLVWARSLHRLHRFLSPILRAGIGSNFGSRKVIVFMGESLTLTEERNIWYTVAQTSNYLRIFAPMSLLRAVLNGKAQLSFWPGATSLALRWTWALVLFSGGNYALKNLAL